MDKVQFVSHIKQLPSPERRNAELALFCHQPQQAEAIYLQASLPFRAIQLNMNLFNWERYNNTPSLIVLRPISNALINSSLKRWE